MKKIAFLLLFSLTLLISACDKADQDPFAEYRGKTSTTLFSKGEEALAHGNYATAAKYFEALDGLYPFGPHAQQGQLDVIYAYYMNGDDASAITSADRYIRLYPRSKNIDYAYYMRGVIGFDLGLGWMQKKVGIDPSSRDVSNLEQSFSAFASVAEQFPRSPYAQDSLVHMAYIRNQLAKRQLDVAHFYAERKAYVAAANRASDVVQHYQGTDQVRPALEMMLSCYRHLGLRKMEHQTLALLQANYPGATYFKKG